MKLRLFILFLFVQHLGIAQGPGYMGKKIFISGNFEYSPDYASLLFLNGSHVKDNGELTNIFANSLKLSVNLNYVINEHKSLELGYGQQTINYNLGLLDKSFDFLIKCDYVHANVSTFTFGISENEGTAPVGMYNTSRLAILKADVEYYYTDPTTSLKTTTQCGSSYDFGIIQEIGFRRVFADQFVLQTGMTFSVYFNGIVKFLTNRGENNPNEYLKGNILTYNYINNIVTVKAGVGYIF